MSQLVTYRPINQADLNFIYSTWLKSYRQSIYATNISNDIYFLEQKEVIDSILSRATCTIICNPEDHTQIFGYLVHEANLSIIHFIYTKYNYRKFGLIKNALSALSYNTSETTFITHLPRSYATLKDKHNLQYNPYLLRR